MNALSKKQLCDVIEGKSSCDRIPMTFNMWIHPEYFGEDKTTVQKIFNDYPYDIDISPIPMPSVFLSEENTDFTWTKKTFQNLDTTAIDACVAIDDWNELDEVLKNFPNPYDVQICQPSNIKHEKYNLAQWWYCFFERFWSLRGMENALTDFYLYPDEVHRLFQKLTEFYLVIIQRAHDELHADGIFTSDDIGTQTSPFFSLEIFREFFKPYYKQLFDKAHSLGMHFWLHTCGDIELFIPELIEIGLDVLHPIQRHTMDEQRVATQYGSQICFLVGFDVQQTIPFGSIQDVKDEVHFLIDTFSRKDGRFILTVGNNSTPDWLAGSVLALFDETYHYGKIKIDDLTKK